MKNRNNFYSIALVSISLITFLIPFSFMASSAPVKSAFPNITETYITANGSVWGFPAICGDRIVWLDNRNNNGSLPYQNLNIYMYNISTSKETRITNSESVISSPAIYGDRIVWNDNHNGTGDIYMYNISTSKETRITTSGSVDYGNAPAIYGDRIVWLDNRNNNGDSKWDIYMYDLSTSKETRITTDGSASNPVIYGDRVVWIDGCSGNGSNICMYNISTHKETQITTNAVAFDPAIYGDRIVWDDYRNGDYGDIYMYDLSISKEAQITTNGSDQKIPSIYGDRVLWLDNRNGDGYSNWDIYMYDLSTSKETRITTDGSASSPAIYGDRIVWANRDVYMVTLSPNLPVAAISASPTSGNEPPKVSFTDRSTGSPNSWKWNLGDGTSPNQDPVHIYNRAGKYTVSLKVSNAAGSNAVTKSSYVVVNALKAPVVAFLASPTSGKEPLTVKFFDKSTGSSISYLWSFGDKSTSTARDPVHKYGKAGKYTVNLTVNNSAGSTTVTKPCCITVK